ncbi:Lrp/AsnC family transcriptional regulator [Flavobacterium daejeonense]|uniref:Lrp/AsnC family transcriptional regulator n=1 Tax=Flavobacterium daejeonense TaxID=350893 RepID=UPI00047B7A3A|nr:Lrp/AsnC ligand binding domain-containing protein [Flavobacterium daejeonense]
MFTSISIKNHNTIHVADFIREMNKIPEVMEVYHIGENYHFLVKVVMQNMESYLKFVLHRLSDIPDIDHIQSSFALSNNKYTTAFNL